MSLEKAWEGRGCWGSPGATFAEAFSSWVQRAEPCLVVWGHRAPHEGPLRILVCWPHPSPLCPVGQAQNTWSALAETKELRTSTQVVPQLALVLQQSRRLDLQELWIRVWRQLDLVVLHSPPRSLAGGPRSPLHPSLSRHVSSRTGGGAGPCRSEAAALTMGLSPDRGPPHGFLCRGPPWPSLGPQS